VPQHFCLVDPRHEVGIDRNTALAGRHVSEEDVQPASMFRVGTEVQPNGTPAAGIGQQGLLLRIDEERPSATRLGPIEIRRPRELTNPNGTKELRHDKTKA